MKNNKLLALAIVAASVVAAPAFAQDSTSAPASGNYQPSQAVGSGNWFIGASVGRTDGNNDGGFGSHTGNFNFLKGEQDRRTGYGLLGGYRWKVGNDLGLGVEGGYTDLGNYRVKNIFNSGDVNQRTSTNALRGWLVGVNGKLNLVPQWYLTAHGGFFRANDNGTNYNNSVGQSLGLSSGGRPGRGSWYAGVGTGWDINEHVGVGVGYDYFHANAGKVRDDSTGEISPDFKRSTGIVSLNGEYRF
ncbi:MAG TPA: porin family protein [Luteibacter sp.]|jgi:outer membrane immunogenic protein|nr:porin family protein [Luteibacter sp.]